MRMSSKRNKWGIRKRWNKNSKYRTSASGQLTELWKNTGHHKMKKKDPLQMRWRETWALGRPKLTALGSFQSGT